MTAASNDEPATLTLAEALLLMRMFVVAATAPLDERILAHMALDRIIAVCAESGLEASS